MRLLVLLALLPGCNLFSFDDGSAAAVTTVRTCSPAVQQIGTIGANERIMFSFGPDEATQNPVAAHGTFTVFVTGLGETHSFFGTDATPADQVPAGLTVRSSNPMVATATGTIAPGCLAQSTVDVTTLAAGSFDLEIDDATGAIYDQVHFDVEEPDHIQTAYSSWDGAAVVVGSVQPVELMLMDANDEPLYDANTIQLAFDGSLAAATTSDGLQGVVATTTGVGHVIATSGSASFTATLTGIDVSAVDTVKLAVLDKTKSDSVTYATVSAWATAGGQSVFGTSCTWDAHTIAMSVTADDFVWGPTSTYQVSGPSTSYPVTCTIGSASTTLTIH